MEDSLKCNLCYELANDAVESMCPCNLIYCLECCKQISECKLCYNKLSYKRRYEKGKDVAGFCINQLARKLISNLTIQCKSCNQKILHSESYSHFSQCTNREYFCVYCNKPFPNKSQFQDHVIADHDRFIVLYFDKKQEADKLKVQYDQMMERIKQDKQLEEYKNLNQKEVKPQKQYEKGVKLCKICRNVIQEGEMCKDCQQNQEKWMNIEQLSYKEYLDKRKEEIKIYKQQKKVQQNDCIIY